MSGSDGPKKGAPQTGTWDGYKVGYAKPPVEHQFPKNKSGNPRGRPRKERPVAAKPVPSGLSQMQKLWLKEAEALLQISVGGRVEKVTAAEAVMLSVRQKALAGGIMAQRTYLDHIRNAQLAARDLELQSFEAYLEYKEWAEGEIWVRKEAGVPYDDILPHPDDIIIGPRTGFFRIVGPVDRHERQKLEPELQLLDLMQERISEAAERYATASKAKKPDILKRWHDIQACYDRINDLMPPSLQR